MSKPKLFVSYIFSRLEVYLPKCLQVKNPFTFSSSSNAQVFTWRVDGLIFEI